MKGNSKLTIVLNICIILIIVMATGAVLAACGQEKPAQPTQTTQPAPAPVKLKLATYREPDVLDPTSTAGFAMCVHFMDNCIERLINLEPDGTIKPGIASWEILEGGKAYIFTLRDGIKFHSGDPLTAADVKFSHDRSMEKCSQYTRATRNIDKVEVIDKLHIKFTFKSPDVAFLPEGNLRVVSKTYYDKVGEAEFVKKPNGTGPYKFVEWKQGQYMDFVVNENYWGKQPQVKEARIFVVREDTTRVSMLKSGEADVIAAVPFQLVKDLQDAKFNVVKIPVRPSTGFQFHNGNPKVPWYDKKVRLAMAMSIDYNAIVDGLFKGIPERYPRLAPWEIGYDPDLKQYPYDPAGAKKLLAEAGYPNGFEMPLYYFTSSPGVKETTEAAVLYLKAIGITCKVQGYESIEMMNNIRGWHANKEKAEAVIVAPFPGAHYADPSISIDTAYFSGSALGIYWNTEVDKLIEQMRSEMDAAKRAELIKKTHRLIHEDVATVSIWVNNEPYATKSNITFTPTLKSSYPLLLLEDMVVKQ